MANMVYAATSLDGYIADKNDGLDWLNSIPNPENSDFGWAEFLSSIDAIVMGRRTYEVVCSFEDAWPYTKPVFVLSNQNGYTKQSSEQVHIINGTPNEIVNNLKDKGYRNLYIDGGITVKHFLEANLIDEMIITVIPVLLGGGISLFHEMSKPLSFELVKSERILSSILKNHYKRI